MEEEEEEEGDGDPRLYAKGQPRRIEKTQGSFVVRPPGFSLRGVLRIGAGRPGHPRCAPGATCSSTILGDIWTCFLHCSGLLEHKEQGCHWGDRSAQQAPFVEVLTGVLGG